MKWMPIEMIRTIRCFWFTLLFVSLHPRTELSHKQWTKFWKESTCRFIRDTTDQFHATWSRRINLTFHVLPLSRRATCLFHAVVYDTPLSRQVSRKKHQNPKWNNASAMTQTRHSTHTVHTWTRARTNTTRYAFIMHRRTHTHHAHTYVRPLFV